jgi:hypothetical protein
MSLVEASCPSSQPNRSRLILPRHADAVLAYKNWTPEQPERLIKIGPRFYSIMSVCDFVDRFKSPLPEHICQKLHSCMHGTLHGEVLLIWKETPHMRLPLAVCEK